MKKTYIPKETVSFTKDNGTNPYKWFTEFNMPFSMEIIICNEQIGDDVFAIVKKGEAVLCLGEIQNMRGHIAFTTKEGKIHWGYHPDNFRRAKDDEV